MKNDCEGELLNSIITSLTPYITQDDMQSVKNAVIGCLFKYDISTKSTDIVVYDNWNEKILSQFIATKRIEGRSEKTLERYRMFIEKLCEFYPNLTLKEITTSNLRFFLAMYQEKGKSSNTSMDGIRRIYSSFFNWLADEDYIDKSPAKRLSKIKHDTMKEEPFTEWKMEALMLAAHSIKDKAILEFMYSTACRVSELCKANLSDINFIEKRMVIHGKGKKDRTVPLTDKALFYLNEYLKEREESDDVDAVFITNRRPYRRVTEDTIRRKLALIAKKAKVKHAHPHRYRVTRITTLLKRGMKLEEVQVIAGHSDISTTAMYNRSDMSLVESEFRRRG